MINHRVKRCGPSSVIDRQTDPESENPCSKATWIVWRIIHSDIIHEDSVRWRYCPLSVLSKEAKGQEGMIDSLDVSVFQSKVLTFPKTCLNPLLQTGKCAS